MRQGHIGRLSAERAKTSGTTQPISSHQMRRTGVAAIGHGRCCRRRFDGECKVVGNLI